ncbi:MAG: glycerate kinase [Quinella sp. 3Q1]|nr:glycerate kinase [Quinella sp. 3Q1]MBR3051331.1 glycerate kinase [Selenomonadaceae bacterium]MBR6888506.1 glycerate kinase [Selenomonadaceae bacterium]
MCRRIVVAIDSLKGSLTSLEAGAAARDGILSASPKSTVKVFPLADGGEGTCRAIIAGLGGKLKSVEVTDPLGGKVSAEFGEVLEKKLAVIEMANAAGLPLVPEDKRNPLNTTTYGVGELIKIAIADGCRDFVIGIGGSATNDCGLGMLTALGYNFGGGIYGRDLEKISAIDDSNVLPELRDCKFRIACDVTNPLTGANGCSAVYGPQKGATPETIAQMDDWIKNFGELSAEFLKLDKKSAAGDGAAGGLGFAFRSYLRGSLLPGVDLVLDALNIAEDLKTADVLITGEGRLDYQTAQGKAPSGVAKLAKKLNPKILTVGIGGSVADISDDAGLDAVFPILREPMTLADAMKKNIAAENISATVKQIIRLINSVNPPCA